MVLIIRQLVVSIKKKINKSLKSKLLKKKKLTKNKKKGGSRVIGGDSVPPTFLQKITSSFDGSNPYSIDYTNFLDLNKTPAIFSHAPMPNLSLSSKGLDIGSRGNVNFNNAQPSGPYSWLDSWKNPVTSELPSKNIMKEFGSNPLDSNNIGYLQAGGAKQTKKKRKGGGSSDWRSTVYSRGPVNYPGQSIDQYSKFANPNTYISNKVLSEGLADNFNASKLIKTSLLSPEPGVPDGFNYKNGIPTSNFTGGKRKVKK